MVLLEGLGAAFRLIPDPVWAAVHLVTALTGFWFAYKLKDNKMFMLGFTLYGITGVLYTLVHFGQVDSYATHILESVLVFAGAIAVGTTLIKK